MSARTDALVSQQETGKITASIVLRCGRLPPSMSCRFNADDRGMFPRNTQFLAARDIATLSMAAHYLETPETRRNIRSGVQF
jgi:hypothetical protein